MTFAINGRLPRALAGECQFEIGHFNILEEASDDWTRADHD
jgi:hypothetical protein